MTEQTMPADKAREIIAGMRESMRRAECDGTSPKFMSSMLVYVAALEALLPPPPRPTLADMTPEERRDCQWMQADVKGEEITAGIIAKINPTDAHLIASDGETWFLAHDTVTPRPDLPRLEWPGDQKPDPALPEGWRLADHLDLGRVIVTTPTPTSDGRVYYVLPSADPLGYDWLSCDPAELTYIDQEGDTPTGPDHLAVGTVIESADDPRIAALPVGSILLDRDGEATTKLRGDWTGPGYTPIEGDGGEYGPWTVLHIPKEDDQ